jgi:hypothetical protein
MFARDGREWVEGRHGKGTVLKGSQELNLLETRLPVI